MRKSRILLLLSVLCVLVLSVTGLFACKPKVVPEDGRVVAVATAMDAVSPNGGNAEYLRDGENCLTYPLGDEEAAAEAVGRIAADAELREKLREEGLRTADARDWAGIREEIVRRYEEAAFRGETV